MFQMNQQLIRQETGDLPPQDVGAADGAEGPEEDSGSRSNKELENKAETERKWHSIHRPLQKVSLLQYICCSFGTWLHKVYSHAVNAALRDSNALSYNKS